MTRPRLWAWVTVLGCLLAAVTAHAQDGDTARRMRFEFSPTARAQVALWIERADGTYMRTIALTSAVARRGIGNRPGAMQMNSGFRWPWGRREGVLPVWAHHRAESTHTAFSRVIFNGRNGEGNASQAGDPPGSNTPDEYYCLSFADSTTRRDALDAISCASQFNSNKGRYLGAGESYAEPFETDDGAIMRDLGPESLYPPRRDLAPCTGSYCNDHADTMRYDEDARRVLPEIDVVTAATFAEMTQEPLFTVPNDWPDGDYVAFIEVNVEGDYNEAYNDQTYPTPENPAGQWDYWAIRYGYPYRGQPSIVYRVPFTLSAAGGRFQTMMPEGYGALDGADGEVRPLDATITNDPTAARGSGVDRLHALGDGNRFVVEVVPTAVCTGTNPPPICGMPCTEPEECGVGFICNGIERRTGACTGFCDAELEPERVETMLLEAHPDEKESHHWARLQFVVPSSERPISRYEVRTSTSPIDDEASFMRAIAANAARLDTVQLVVPTEGAAGEPVQVDLGGLLPETPYYVAMRAVDTCNSPGPLTVREVTTTPINFTTVSPCFIATAAYGTPLDADIRALRRFRDREMLVSPIGRALASLYDEVGPVLADLVRDDETLRSIARHVIEPIAALADSLD